MTTPASGPGSPPRARHSQPPPDSATILSVFLRQLSAVAGAFIGGLEGNEPGATEVRRFEVGFAELAPHLSDDQRGDEVEMRRLLQLAAERTGPHVHLERRLSPSKAITVGLLNHVFTPGTAERGPSLSGQVYMTVSSVTGAKTATPEGV